MMNVLGPIASDPRLVQNQMSQIAVMKEDFNEKLPTRDRYNELGDFLLENTGDSPDSRKIEDKLDGTNKKWDDLLAALNERERALNDLAGPTNDFLNLTNKLQDNLSNISDDLDDVATSKADVEQKMAALQVNFLKNNQFWPNVEKNHHFLPNFEKSPFLMEFRKIIIF